MKIPAKAAERYPFVTALSAGCVYEMVLVENAWLYMAGGDGFYYRADRVGVTHIMHDNGKAWRESVEGRKMTPSKLQSVESL